MEDLIKGLGPSAPYLIIAVCASHKETSDFMQMRVKKVEIIACAGARWCLFALPVVGMQPSCIPVVQREKQHLPLVQDTGAPRVTAHKYCSASTLAVYCASCEASCSVQIFLDCCAAAGSYETKTQGTRHQEAARVVGEGMHCATLIAVFVLGTCTLQSLPGPAASPIICLRMCWMVRQYVVFCALDRR